MPQRPNSESELSSAKNPQAGAETDLAELAALFTERSKGSVSPEVATDLALDIVLNEIVEQACAVTGATGAAIILPLDGELVCRASNGENAPEMGARLSSDTGLTAECIKSRKVQRSDDAYVDPRADIEASRSLGVRSVLVFPLLRNGELSGLLEVFSSQAAAFGKREELVLEALGERVLKNLARAREILISPNLLEDRERNPKPAAEEPSPERQISVMASNRMASDQMASEIMASNTKAADIMHSESMGPETMRPDTKGPDRMGSAMKRSDEDQIFAVEPAAAPRNGSNQMTFALTAAIVVCALLLATLLGMRALARRSAIRREPAPPTTIAQVAEPSTSAQTKDGTSGQNPAVAVAPESTGTAEKVLPTTGAIAKTSDDPLPQDGSLRVYEEGKEVFRLPGNGRAESLPSRSGVQRAAALEAISPVAAGSVLHRVEPEYPEQARQQKLQGAVVVDVLIGRDGSVQDVKLVSGQEVLADAAMRAVKQWRFKPRVEQGQAVEMQTRVTLNFRMPG